MPVDQKIADSIEKLQSVEPKYRVVYNLLLDSGLRLVEACYLINNFNKAYLEKFDNFYRYELGMFRGSKQAYYAFFTEQTFQEIEHLSEKVDPKSASKYIQKRCICAK